MPSNVYQDVVFIDMKQDSTSVSGLLVSGYQPPKQSIFQHWHCLLDTYTIKT